MSTSSSTSDASSREGERSRFPASSSRRDLAAATVRLTHPFPSLLDGAATVAIGLVAAGSGTAAVLSAAKLGIAMVCLQAAIGATNDVVDRNRDAGRKPGKPIPAGLVTATQAKRIAAVAAVAGLVLSATSGPLTLAVGVAILAIGLAYDLWLRGTAWSWLPFAAGIPLLPVYAWIGTGTRLPALFAVLVPMAFLAGAALAIANSLADVERDRESGASSIADRLGHDRAWVAHAVLHAVVVAVALGTLTSLGAPPGPVALAIVAAAAVGAGIALARGHGADRRERGWELEAVGVAMLAAGWIAGLAPLAK